VQAELSIDRLDDFDAARHRRLAACMLLAAALVLLLLAVLEWPEPQRFLPLARPVLDVTLEEAPQPEVRPQVPPLPLPETEAETTPAEAPPAAAATPESLPAERPATAGAETAETTQPAVDGLGTPAAVDWYAELERVAEAVGNRLADEPQSMHPEFDELRRIAKLFYGKPKTNPPPPSWEVEKDIYGRTLLKKGNMFRVLDDTRLFNEEAFRLFERHMTFIVIPLGRRKPENLPWVELIRARYEYMREPDELPPLKTVVAPAADP